MKDLSQVDYFPDAEQLVDILCAKTQTANRHFFRIQVAYNFCKLASMMRAELDTPDRGRIPINMYAINLAPSGFGKGHSTAILEQEVFKQFKETFIGETLPVVSQVNLITLANKRARQKGSDPDQEILLVEKEYDSLGEMAFSFDSGTPAAVKQMRHKLLMADAGSINLEMDEFGSNLLGNSDVLTTFLELFDKGLIKQKLTKNTAENKRSKEIEGGTPTNVLLYGTPTRLLNGGKEESEFMTMLDTGYARRCFFGYASSTDKLTNLTPEQVFDLMTDSSKDAFLQDLSQRSQVLAEEMHFKRTIKVPKDISIILIGYKQHCERVAEAFAEHEEIRKSELSHRYFKALKLAGAYAFMDGSDYITEDHLYAAIKLAEDSGDAFNTIFTRDRNHVKLAKYIANSKRDVTNVDLVEDLPFYRGSSSQKAELMSLALAWGYRNNIIIKRKFEDGIEFLSGEALETTDLDKLIISYSKDWTEGYTAEYAPFSKLHKLTQANGMHWVNHHLVDGYRKEDNAIQGFNMVVIDVDGTANMNVVKDLLQDYAYHIYTTKSHTPECHRFRLVLPMSHTLYLDAKEFTEFMMNIYEWLPFEVDTQTKQRSRKWSSHSMEYHTNEGQLFDVLPFIPKTSKNDERKAALANMSNLDNLERWFVNNIGAGNRSNQLIKYAFCLIDAGKDFSEIQSRVLALNEKIPDKLEETEILTTIMKTVTNRLLEQAKK